MWSLCPILKIKSAFFYNGHEADLDSGPVPLTTKNEINVIDYISFLIKPP